MPLSIEKPKLDNLANEIWKSAERLRGKFKAYEYQNVVLPIIVLRRLECVLLKWREKTKAEIWEKQPERSEADIDALVKKLEQNVQQTPFSNSTDWTLRKVFEEDHTLLEENFRAYLNGFSENVDDIIEHFNYRATIGQMVKNNRLAPILSQYKELDLGPDRVRIGTNFVALPPKKEQEEIASFLNTKEQELNDIRTTIEAQITTLLAYRKSLIHECVTGKRRITKADLAKVQEKASEEWRTKQK